MRSNWRLLTTLGYWPKPYSPRSSWSHNSKPGRDHHGPDVKLRDLFLLSWLIAFALHAASHRRHSEQTAQSRQRAASASACSWVKPGRPPRSCRSCRGSADFIFWRDPWRTRTRGAESSRVAADPAFPQVLRHGDAGRWRRPPHARPRWPRRRSPARSRRRRTQDPAADVPSVTGSASSEPHRSGFRPDVPPRRRWMGPG